MIIDKDFVGGNINVLSISGDMVDLAGELRDSTTDWFYWAFRVRGAAGRRITFRFPHKTRVGYWGAAVSRDMRSWRWTGNRGEEKLYGKVTAESFEYSFAPDEDEVYFAHDIVYTPDRFFDFCREEGITPETLCISERGREVPCIKIGKGEKKIIMASRHHCCESTGTYVLESVLHSFIASPIEGYQIFCVPFVDFDGVIDGDQGKNRAPWDHNRDYPIDGSSSIYSSCRAIRDFSDNNTIAYAFDFHSPYHKGGQNDKVYIPYPYAEDAARLDRFSDILEKKITKDSLPYDKRHNFPADTDWNKSTNPTFARYMINCAGRPMALTLETPYFGNPENASVTTLSSLSALGKCFYEALREYIQN